MVKEQIKHDGAVGVGSNSAKTRTALDALLSRTQEREKTTASKIVAAIMNTKHEIEVRSKNYIPRDQFEARLNLILGQIFMFIRCLPIRVQAYTENEKKCCVKVSQAWQRFVAQKLLTEIDIAALEKKQEEDFSSPLEVLELQNGVALNRELEARKQAQKGEATE